MKAVDYYEKYTPILSEKKKQTQSTPIKFVKYLSNLVER